MAIDLTFNEQQRMIQETARSVFERMSSPAAVRRYETDAEEFPRELWRQMAELGWLGMTFPEAYDGLDCPITDQFALYEEIGRALAPTPHLETVALAGELVLRLGSEDQKRRLLPAIAAGETVLTCALMEPDGLYGPAGVALLAEKAGDGFSLTGEKVLVPYARSADLIVCPARTAGAAGAEDGVSLFLVDPKAAGVKLEPMPTMTGQRLSAVRLDGVRVARPDALGPIGGAWPALDDVIARAGVLLSALVAGAGERVLEISVGYAKDRVQFGEPIGKYQAVQYLCSDVAIHARNTRLLALQAAWRIESGTSFHREAALAKASASKAAAAMTYAAQEVHAGIGFMLDYDLQLYTRRAKHWEYSLGDQRHHLERVMAESEAHPRTGVAFFHG
jgi:alkylation response protein AidB-like acyl-CoA dehydrogenase